MKQNDDKNQYASPHRRKNEDEFKKSRIKGCCWLAEDT
jgi:hypothetical protein